MWDRRDLEPPRGSRVGRCDRATRPCGKRLPSPAPPGHRWRTDLRRPAWFVERVGSGFEFSGEVALLGAP